MPQALAIDAAGMPWRGPCRVRTIGSTCAPPTAHGAAAGAAAALQAAAVDHMDAEALEDRRRKLHKVAV